MFDSTVVSRHLRLDCSNVTFHETSKTNKTNQNNVYLSWRNSKRFDRNNWPTTDLAEGNRDCLCCLSTGNNINYVSPAMSGWTRTEHHWMAINNATFHSGNSESGMGQYLWYHIHKCWWTSMYSCLFIVIQHCKLLKKCLCIDDFPIGTFIYRLCSIAVSNYHRVLVYQPFCFEKQG